MFTVSEVGGKFYVAGGAPMAGYPKRALAQMMVDALNNPRGMRSLRTVERLSKLKHFKICNRISGADLGVYSGETSGDALNAMARDAGYRDYADACADVGGEGELLINEVIY